jgi:hypothetical protein
MSDDAGEAGSNKPAEVDRQALMSALTTEHFTLQGARASTVSESTARATLFVGALSSCLIALGFIAQASKLGRAFDVFTLVILPTLYVLGVFTFARLVACSLEDLNYGRAINRIRGYYLELAGTEARYFALVGLDDTAGVLINMGITRPSRWQLYWTLASMVAVLTAVVGGITVAFLAGVLGASLAPAATVGALCAVASAGLAHRSERTAHIQAQESAQPLFPSTDTPTTQPR